MIFTELSNGTTSICSTLSETKRQCEREQDDDEGTIFSTSLLLSPHSGSVTFALGTFKLRLKLVTYFNSVGSGCGYLVTLKKGLGPINVDFRERLRGAEVGGRVR